MVATKWSYTSSSRQLSRGHRRWRCGWGSRSEGCAVQQPVQADALRRVTPLAQSGKRRAASRARLNVALDVSEWNRHPDPTSSDFQLAHLSASCPDQHSSGSQQNGGSITHWNRFNWNSPSCIQSSKRSATTTAATYCTHSAAFRVSGTSRVSNRWRRLVCLACASAFATNLAAWWSTPCSAVNPALGVGSELQEAWATYTPRLAQGLGRRTSEANV